MRLRTFTAPSIGEAMRQVREVLGPDAVILTTEQIGKTVKLTAATEPAAATPSTATVAAVPAGGEDIESALRYHGVPKALTDWLLATSGDLEGASPQQALTAALRARFDFRPLIERKPAK